MTLEFFAPALAGYLLLRLSYFSKYGLLREAGYHVVFRSTLMGLVLYVAGAAIVECGLIPQDVRRWLDAVREATNLHLSEVAVASLLLGAGLPFAINRLYRKKRAARRLAEKKGDLVGLSILEAFKEGSLVEASLVGGKTYLGFVTRSSFDDHGDETGTIQIVPLLSGHRDEKQGLKLDTNYSKALVESSVDLTLSIRGSELRWFRRFDLALYPWGAHRPLTLRVAPAPQVAN